MAFSTSIEGQSQQAIWQYMNKPTTKAIETELVYLSKGVWILPIILYDVDIIRRSKEPCKSRCFRVPKWSGDDAFQSYS